MEQSVQTIKDKLTQNGQTTDTVLIVAATKTVEANRINKLKDYGIFDAGENRVQELIQKYDFVDGIRWHFIGSLQKNKVKYIVDKVCLIHSVDSIGLAEEIAKRAEKIAKTADILVEVNIGNEPTKSGIKAEELFALCDMIVQLKNVRLRGLMTVMPPNAGQELYQQMQSLFLQARDRYGSLLAKGADAVSDTSCAKKGVPLIDYTVSSLLAGSERNSINSNKPSIDFLSVGMSGDYEQAIKFGANIIRPGSAIFGKRSYQI